MSKRELEMSGAPLSNYGEPAQPQSLLTLTGPSSRWQTFEVPTEEGPWARSGHSNGHGGAVRGRKLFSAGVWGAGLWKLPGGRGGLGLDGSSLQACKLASLQACRPGGL